MRDITTPLGIAVLGLLTERPMHPYEMCQLLTERHEDRLVKIRVGSVYHAVESLAAAGLVAATGTDRCGRRPERTTYAVTEAGRAALLAQVASLVREPVNEYPPFLAGLSEIHKLDRDTALALLRERGKNMQRLLDDIDTVIADAREKEVPEAYWLAAGFLRDRYATERDWLQDLAARAESGELLWPVR